RRHHVASHQFGITFQCPATDETALVPFFTVAGLAFQECNPPINPSRQCDPVRWGVLTDVAGSEQSAQLFARVRQATAKRLLIAPSGDPITEPPCAFAAAID